MGLLVQAQATLTFIPPAAVSSWVAQGGRFADVAHSIAIAARFACAWGVTFLATPPQHHEHES